MPKSKAPLNGFFLFRMQMKNECRTNGKRMNEEELTKFSGDLWEALDEETKEEWKMRAKEEKLKSRSATAASQIISNTNRNDPSSSRPVQRMDAAPPPRPKAHPNKVPALKQESVFKAWEDLEMQQRPDKKRGKDRKSFENAFFWKYNNKGNDLKKQRFYLISSSVLCYLNDGTCIPAEIACVEFTVESGVTHTYCTPLKPFADFPDDADIKAKVKEISGRTHQFTLQDLEVTGKTCREVASQLIEMSHKREPSCQNVRFFILNSQLRPTWSCLQFLLKQSDLENRYKSMTEMDVATVDDLAHGLFKYFEVDYPKNKQPPPSTPTSWDPEAVDFDYFQDLIDGKEFRRVTCEIHNDYDDAAVCCESQLYLAVEIIRSCVEKKKFDTDALIEFAASTDPFKARYYQPTGSSTYAESVMMYEDEHQDEGNCGYEYEIEQPFEENDECEYVVEVEDEEVNQINGDQNLSQAGTISPVDTFSPSMPVVPPMQSIPPVMEGVSNAYFDPIFNPSYGNGNILLRAPNTLAVQHLLPSGRRGFGRGMRLCPESQLFDRLKYLKNLTS